MGVNPTRLKIRHLVSFALEQACQTQTTLGAAEATKMLKGPQKCKKIPWQATFSQIERLKIA